MGTTTLGVFQWLPRGGRALHSCICMGRSTAKALIYSITVLGMGALFPALAGAEFYVTNAGNESVTVYTRTSNGDAAPIRVIVGGSTGYVTPFGVSLDEVNTELFVANTAFGTMTVHDANATGDTAPLRTLTGLGGNNDGVVVDPVNNEVVNTNYSSATIRVFSRTASGAAVPLRTITGGLTTLNGPIGVALDLTNDEIVVGNNGASIATFARTASGNVAPLRSISGAATGLSAVWDVDVDSTNDEIFAAVIAGSIRVFARTATGDVAPLRVIAGLATGLSSPTAVVVDLIHDEIVVVNSGNNSVTVYSRTANGNVAPLRTITGFSTGLNFPLGLAVVDDASTPIPSETPTPTETVTPTETDIPTATETPTPTPTIADTPTATATSAFASCAATPRSGCVTAPSGKIKIKNNSDPSKRQLLWKWSLGTADIDDFGDPYAGANYRLCVYDDGVKKVDAAIEAAGPCDTISCWKETTTSRKYKHQTGNADGIRKVKFKAGVSSAKMLVKGKGMNLDNPLPFTAATSVTVQFVANPGGANACFESVFLPANKNETDQFSDKIP